MVAGDLASYFPIIYRSVAIVYVARRLYVDVRTSLIQNAHK